MSAVTNMLAGARPAPPPHTWIYAPIPPPPPALHAGSPPLLLYTSPWAFKENATSTTQRCRSRQHPHPSEETTHRDHKEEQAARIEDDVDEPAYPDDGSLKSADLDAGERVLRHGFGVHVLWK